MDMLSFVVSECEITLSIYDAKDIEVSSFSFE